MAKTVKILDGGFATQLSKYVGENVDGDPLWSAKFNYTDKEAVIKSHKDFLNAGADIILTNTYQASVEGYTKYLNLSEDESIELIKNTVKLAHEAREMFLSENNNNVEGDIFVKILCICNNFNEKQKLFLEVPKIFASIGPYGAHCHDGSEYTGSYADTVSPEEIKKWHRVRLNAVLEAGVDCLAVETIPCEVRATISVCVGQ